MSESRLISLAAVVNLLIPGAGIIILQRIWTGLLVGLAFIVCANYALWVTLLVPYDFAPWARGLSIGLAGGAYVGAQIRLAYTAHSRQHQLASALRHETLAAVQDCLRRGDFLAAAQALEPLREQHKNDLFIAYRAAQIASGLKEPDAIKSAWRQVQKLDKHHIYRAEVRAVLAASDKSTIDLTAFSRQADGEA
ncbi:MAG: hypothetical protein ABIG44_00400 [Planctomycetota bacterium]